MDVSKLSAQEKEQQENTEVVTTGSKYHLWTTEQQGRDWRQYSLGTWRRGPVEQTPRHGGWGGAGASGCQRRDLEVQVFRVSEAHLRRHGKPATLGEGDRNVPLPPITSSIL
jgi:hypothetical protein